MYFWYFVVFVLFNNIEMTLDGLSLICYLMVLCVFLAGKAIVSVQLFAWDSSHMTRFYISTMWTVTWLSLRWWWWQTWRRSSCLYSMDSLSTSMNPDRLLTSNVFIYPSVLDYAILTEPFYHGSYDPKCDFRKAKGQFAKGHHVLASAINHV